MITKHTFGTIALTNYLRLLQKKSVDGIAPLKVKKDGDALKLYAPNKFMKEEIEKNFLSKIAGVVNQLAENTLISLDVNSSVKKKKKLEQCRLVLSLI